ncbi:ATP-binding protein [Kosakonia sp.]|uniref:ATP-binding protein n=1 Tax=Kosakonia sp. TaxID=1916651 RepID=UPI00289833C1|nr:ATP-binding protein [Kosakonia sp.]
MSLYSGSDGVSTQGVSNDDDNFYYSLERIDLLFQHVYWQGEGRIPDNFSLYFLPPESVGSRLTFLQGEPAWLSMPASHLPGSCAALTQRMNNLINRFDLTLTERDILLACLLPRLSDHYAALPDSGIAEGISQQRLLQMLGTSGTEYQLLLSALHPASPLFQFALLNKKTITSSKTALTFYTVSESVWHFFCGNGSLAKYSFPYPRHIEAQGVSQFPAWVGEHIYRLCLDSGVQTPPVIVLDGPGGNGRTQDLANTLAKYLQGVLHLEILELASLAEMQQRQTLTEIIRDALLDNCALLLGNWSTDSAVNQRVAHTLDRLLPLTHLPVFILPDVFTDFPPLQAVACVHVSVPHATIAEIAHSLHLGWPEPQHNKRDKQALQALAERYAFHPADIPLLMMEADYYRQLRDRAAPLDTEDLRQTLLFRSRKNFGKLAQRIVPVRGFDDMVVSPSVQKQLNEILVAIRLRESVTIKHFAHKTGGKTGISALFYGDSGTGKTLAAEVLAQHLGVDVIKVDLSTVVSKYVGETEKNLSQVFDLAEADSGVLFFDEADALFGKRSETKDAHDRHANIEVAYLLQRLENYPGLVILATNNRGHLDTAFSRRFTFITHFTYPDAELREQMWQKIWPATLKVADDVDFAKLAVRTDLTGASIRNVALLAAVLAADEQSEKIASGHIERALKRELGKLGRVLL